MPLEFSKLAGPETCPTFFGNRSGQPPYSYTYQKDKLDKLKRQLRGAINVCLSIPKEELKSLVGLLQFATKVVRPGRPFLHGLYALKDVGR